MTSILADLRVALRSARHRPGFTAIAVLTIGLGIGATTAVFSVLRTVLLEPLPYAAAERLVTLHTGWANQAQGDELSGPELLDLRTVAAFSGVAAYNTGRNAILTESGEPERITATQVTGNIFPLLGVEPVVGRAFTADEDLPGGPLAVMLSYGLWQRRFGGDPALVGRSLTLDGQPRTVVGIMPPGFALPHEFRGEPAELWAPLQFDAANPGGRGSHYLYGLARVATGVTIEQANAAALALAARLTQDGVYLSQESFRLTVQPARDLVVGGVRPLLLLLLVAVGLVLLIACVNVANLLVERAEGRRREFSVRAALGADRGRLLQQLLVEHGVIAGLGALVGLALAAAGIQWLVALAPDSVPRIREVRLDGSVMLVCGGLAVACALLFGLAPLLHAARYDLQAALGAGDVRATMGRAQQRMRRGLVAGELALAIVLLAGAGLTLRTFAALLAVDPGFDPRNTLTLRVQLPPAAYQEDARVTAFYQEALARVRALPGVTAAGGVRVLPLAASIGDWTVELEGREAPLGTDFDGDWQIVTPGYAEAMRLRLLAGRTLTEADGALAPAVAMINETMAREYWPAGDALGKRFRLNGPETPWIEIVGIVGDERHASLSAVPNRRWFRPHAQWTQSRTSPIRGLTFVVRTSGDPMALALPVRQIIRDLDANLPVADVRTLENVVASSVSRQRFAMLLLAVFAGTALVLAAVGVYGVMAYWVTERTREIGVRMALGATGREVSRLVLRQALAPAAAGIAIGAVVALGLTQFMRTMLFGVAPYDPVTFGAAPLLLLAVAAVAAWIPAFRASRQDPAQVLRSE